MNARNPSPGHHPSEPGPQKARLPHPSAGKEFSNQVEGYLLWQARVTESEQRAREFTAPLDWLTTSQRVAIEQAYTADSLRRARADLEHIAARCASLRAEYEHRYRQLRRHCLAWTLTVGTALTAVTTALAFLRTH
ncbi:cytochrome C oxidase subunit I [Streptomyces sp. IBSBF 3136]|uniref:cytochrome C oxidase subunit I n=1 Tax=Streptomyces sp. IBSBF 3136 TaxID=2903524 RepID=UPI002FDBE25B